MGGFSELQKHGKWRLNASEYVALIKRLLGELGPELCKCLAPQDCMCEDIVVYGGVGKRGVVFAGTQELRGLKPDDPEQERTTSVRIHQRLTVDNFVELTLLAPEIRFIPVLQGRTLEDYEHCDQLHHEAGIDLAAAPVVGLGSVCRRQATDEIEAARQLARRLSKPPHPPRVLGVGFCGQPRLVGDVCTRVKQLPRDRQGKKVVARPRPSSSGLRRDAAVLGP